MRAVLSPIGFELRRRLAEAGVEVTPDQLRAAAMEAREYLVRRYPDGDVPHVFEIAALTRAINRRVVR